MGDLEIEIRRSTKIRPVRSRSVAHGMDENGRQKKSVEKLKISQSHWDYSDLLGEKGFN